MVQLTLVGGNTLAEHLEALERRALERLGHPAHGAAAARATMRRFASWGEGPLDARSVSRATAYFDAVLRRLILTSPDEAAARARARMVASSLEADLVEGGWTQVRARAEVERLLGIRQPVEGVA